MKTFTDLSFRIGGDVSLRVDSIWDDLKGYWRFDEGSGVELKDSSGADRKGVVQNSAGGVWASDTPELKYINPSALSVGYNNGYVRIPEGIDLANKSFSISFWTKRPGGGDGWILSQGNGASNQGLHVGFRDTAIFSLAFWGDDLNVNFSPDTGWHHWLVTYDSEIKSQKVFQDGVLLGSRTAGNHLASSGPLLVGKRFDSDGGAHYYGDIDELQIYYRVLTNGEIEALSAGCAVLAYGQAAVTVATVYSMTYHANGGSGTAPTESSKAADDTFAAAAANSFTAPAGRRFKEWNTEADGSGTTYAAGATVTMPASALTLYAIWEAAATANSGLKVTIVESGTVTLNGTQINSNHDHQYPMDMNVRLEATPNTGYTFAYWATVGASNDSIISTNPVYQCTLGAGINVKAVFSKIPSDEDTRFTVVFKDKSGRIMQSSFVDKGKAATPPTDPVIVGYRFNEWSPAYNNVTSDLIVTAIYERLPETYTVTVENGTLSTGGTQSAYQFDKPVTVVADTIPGKQFSHWTLDDVKVSTKSSFSFFAPMRDITLKAVFADEGIPLNDVPFITLSEHVMDDPVNKTMMFTAIKNVPAGYTLVECGAILINSEVPLTLDTPAVLRLKINNFANDQFYVRKINITPGETWYVRAFIIYKDSNGNMVTVYSDNTVYQTMGG